jgi:cytochrome c oxidase subunit 4
MSDAEVGATTRTDPDVPAAADVPPSSPALSEVHAAPHLASGEQGPHPNDAQYIRIAVILAVVTAVEVALYYLKLQRTATNSLLLVFAAVKGSLVALYFMHLKFDNRLLRRLFLGGFILALFVYLAYLTTLGVFR